MHAASIGFMPSLVFPFVKLHAAGSTSGSNESCFEMLATLLMNWTRGEFVLRFTVLWEMSLVGGCL